MTKVLMVNPSINMKLVALELRMYGIDVNYAYTHDIPRSVARRVFYFLSNINICFTTEVQGEMERDDRILLLKNNIFSRLKMFRYNKNMIEVYPELTSGTFIDFLLLKRSVLKYEDDTSQEANITHYDSYQKVVADNKKTTIVTSLLPADGNEMIYYWNTDFDLESTFSEDYFVFFSHGSRIEAFVDRDKLITIGCGLGDEHIKTLSTFIPFLPNYKFIKENEMRIYRNPNPWIISFSNFNNQTFLLNDYSFSKLSVSMPSVWYDRVAIYLSNQILKKKRIG